MKPLNIKATRQYGGSLTEIGNGWCILYITDPIRRGTPESFTAPSRGECLKKAEDAGYRVVVEEESQDQSAGIVGLLAEREERLRAGAR